MEAKPKQYPANAVGSIVCELIHTQLDGIIYGATSRGIFIKTGSRWLIFLSYEPHTGPCTINVPDARHLSTELHPGQQVKIKSGKIAIREDDLVISAQNLIAWQPDPPAFTPLPNAERQERLISASERVTSSDSAYEFSILLPYLVQIPGQVPQGSEQLSRWYRKILNLIKDANTIQSPASIIEILGFGPGLTPSGDDFTIGYLLAHNRWKHILPTPGDLENFNQQVVSAAYRKTTTLSANLIECAAQGMADQRLIDALDWLVSGKHGNIQAIDELLKWGSSSGADVFVGFAAALSSANPKLQAPSY